MTQDDKNWLTNVLLIPIALLTLAAIVTASGGFDQQHDAHWTATAILGFVAVGLFWFREAVKL